MKLRHALATAVLPVLLLAGCGDDEGEDAAPTTTTAAEGSTTTASGDEVLDILVTNDDGYAAAGIDAVVEALRTMKGVTVTVVAPAENQSGTGDKTTPGADLVVAEVKTASGYDATSVAGFPGDSVIVALDELGLDPDLVVSGTNIGQNIGPFSQLSGTVGAAKTAARRGIPGLAASTGTGDQPDFSESASHVVKWVEEHRAELLAGDVEPFVESINTPSCPDDDRGVVEVPLATDFKDRDAFKVDCASTKPAADLVDDVDAFLNGFTSLTTIAF